MHEGSVERTPTTASGRDPAPAYRVLARTYRPQRLSELIGQEAVVRTLVNALASGRIAHAFLLTGIRGVGKTTTARIIARALNCIGPEGSDGPTPEPCGVCGPCVAIADGNHIDVLEMDAATRTGVDDIRELVDSVRYAPTSARYKVYIVDEVHMLSEKAFNALLKTLEEPPPKTIFIFATTEVRKIPVTVLSRCQRFDLRRVEGDRLERHLAAIAVQEGVEVDAAALGLVVRAAEGSVRDGLSLLDQAIALAGDGRITAQQVQDMLGLADRARVLDLFERLLRGEIGGALDLLAELYDLGTEPEAVVQDLLAVAHWLTRLRLTPEETSAFGMADATVAQGRALAQRATMAVLGRTWQMLLKGLDDLRLAPSPLAAAEMLLVRIAYAAELPPPGELARLLGKEPGRTVAAETATAAPVPQVEASAPRSEHARPGRTVAPHEALAKAAPRSFAEVVALFSQNGEPLLHGWLYESAAPVHFETGRIEVQLRPGTPKDIPGRVAEALGRWTGRPWLVSLSTGDTEAGPTLAEQDRAAHRARLDAIAADPRIKPILERFAGARVIDVRPAPEHSEPSELSADLPHQTAEHP